MSSKKNKILVIDDEPQMRRLLKVALIPHEYIVLEAATALEGISAAASENPDVIILDLSLPDSDGQKVLKQIREWFIKPVIVVSVRSDVEDIVMALDAGANDYLRKPFILKELLARLRVCLRTNYDNPPKAVLKFDDLTIDISAHKVFCEFEEVKLTVTEFDLLKYLASHAGRVLTHRQILTQVWGENSAENVEYLRVYIGQLRKKIEKDPTQPQYILTEPGVGYRFEG